MKKKGTGALGIAGRVILIIFAALLLMSYISTCINPSHAWYYSIFGLMFIPLALVNFLFLIWAIALRSRAAIIPLIALLPGFLFLGRYYQYRSGGVKPSEDCIKVLTYNVGHYQYFKGANKEDCLDSLSNYILSQDPDVICFQEFYSSKEIAKTLDEYFPGYNTCYYMNVNSGGRSGNVILSKYPVIDKGHFDFENSSNLAVYGDLQIEDKVVRFYNCHFQSYSVSLPALAKSIGEKEVMMDAEIRYRDGNIKRPRQVEQVLSDIDACPVPAIVVGDFNDTPMSYTYHRLHHGRKDSFVEAGKGFGATYSILWPLLRIDYVLFPKKFSAVSSETPRVPYSDHYPVIARINL